MTSDASVIFARTLPDAFDRAGMQFPGDTEPGTLMRFATNGRDRDDKAGWLRVFPDGTGAVFGDWRDGTQFTWQLSREGAAPTGEEIAALRARAEAARREAEAQRTADYAQAAERATELWQRFPKAPADHAYLLRKAIGAHGAKIDDDGRLVIPVLDVTGAVQSLQFIAGDGAKRFMTGGKMHGGRLILGRPADGSPIVIAEGFATAATIRETTKAVVVVGFSGSNLKLVAADIRRQFPKSPVLIAGDLDAHGAGARYAEAAALAAMPAGTAFPAFLDHRQTGDFNDLAAADSPGAVAAQIDAALSPAAPEWPATDGAIGAFLTTPPPPLEWFADERLLANRAHLLTGIGGSSKTRALFHLGIGAVVGRVPWGWKIGRTGSAALFLAEDTADGVHRALAAMVAHCGLTSPELDAISKRLRVFPLAGVDTRLLSSSQGGSVTENDRAAGLFRKCKAIRDLRFIGLDPALALTEGDEMSPAHQRRLGEMVDRLAIETGACVVLTSHAAKAVQSADEIGSHTSRGSGAITDAVRAEFVLRTMTATEARSFGVADIEERKAFVQLVATKGNSLPPAAFAAIWLRRGAGGILEPADLEPVSGGADVLHRRDLAALDLLRTLSQRGAVTIGDWKAECIAKGIITAAKPDSQGKAMQRIRDALLAHGRIERGIGRNVFLPVEGDFE